MGKTSITILLCICLLQESVFSLPLFEARGEGAESTGLGRCSVLLRGVAFSGVNNPALTGETGLLTISWSFARPYSVPGLVLGSLWASKGWKRTGFGAGFSFYGNDIYREEALTISAGFRPLTSGFGASLSLKRVSIQNLGRRSFASIALGFMYSEMPYVAIGGVVRDLIKLGHHIKDEVRSTGAISASIRFPSTNALLLVECRGSSRYPPSISLGLETRLWRSVDLRMGMGKNPSIYSVGLGIHIAFFIIDLGVEEHTVLGQTRSISITVIPSSI